MTKTSTLPFLKVFRVLYSYNITQCLEWPFGRCTKNLRAALASVFGILSLKWKKKTIRFCYEEIRDPWVNITGSKDGAVMRVLASHRCGLGSIPGVGVTCGLSFLKVLALAPSLRGFSSRSSGFRPSTKNLIPNSNWKRWTRRACPFINYKQKNWKKIFIGKKCIGNSRGGGNMSMSS